jgi:hypothetical protein
MTETILSRMQTRPFLNDSGADIPPFSLIAKASDLVVKDGVVLEKFDKASTTFVWEYAVTNHLVTKSGNPGRYQIGPIVIVGYDPAATPADGDGFGPKPDEWVAFKNYPQCLICRGIVSSSKKLMLASLAPIECIIGKLAGSLSQGGSATVNVWAGAGGSEAVVTSMTLSGRDWLMKSGATAIASGKKVVVKRINGVPYIIEAECA